MVRSVLVGLGLAGVVWLYGTYVAPGGGLDGPCLSPATDFGQEVREGSGISSEFSWLPPTERCVEERRDGRIREQSYPGSATWAVAAAIFLVPLAVRRWAHGRRQRI